MGVVHSSLAVLPDASTEAEVFLPDGAITAFTLSMALANDASTSERSEQFPCHVSFLNNFRPPPSIRCCSAPRLYQIGLADEQLNLFGTRTMQRLQPAVGPPGGGTTVNITAACLASLHCLAIQREYVDGSRCCVCLSRFERLVACLATARSIPRSQIWKDSRLRRHLWSFPS